MSDQQHPQHTRKHAPPTPADINRAQGFAPPRSKTEAAHSVVPAKPAAPSNKAVVPSASAAPPAPTFDKDAFERNLAAWGSGGLPPLMHNGLDGGFRTTGGEEVNVSDAVFVAHLDESANVSSRS